jgi:hypothetical protein
VSGLNRAMAHHRRARRPRTLPIRVAPVPGEALESWLGALAQRLDTPWGDLLTAVMPSSGPSVRRHNLTAHLDEDESAAIATATGIWHATVEALTLTRHDGHLITIDRSTHRVRSPWPPTRSRFCPHCLHSSGGRWQLAWRLPWVFACRAHSCTLADFCPTCGQVQRVSPSWLSTPHVPELEQCGRTTDVDGARRRCGGNLSQATTTALTPDHPLAMTQTRLSQVLSTTSTTSGVYSLRRTSSLQVLRDIRVLGARMLALVDVEGIDELLGRHENSSISGQFMEREIGARSWAQPMSFATKAPALITGIGITLALNVIESDTIDEAAARLRPIITSGRAAGREVTPTTLRHGNLSAVMDAVHLKAFAESFPPIRQLRCRTAATLPRYPGTLSSAVLRSTPTCLWRDWSFRFMVGGFRHEVMAPALSTMLLSTGTQISELNAARRLGSTTTQQKFSRILNGLHLHPLWPNIAAAIIRLFDHLAEHPSPIDYQRRRQLDYQDLLPAERWNEIYDQRDFGRRDRDRVGELARSWLFERVSMLPADASPFANNIARAGRHRSEVVAQFTPAIVRELDGDAARFLQQHNVIGEPVTWSPPLSIVADLELPGPDPTAVPISALHHLLADDDLSMAAAARHLRIPTPLAGYLLECSPLARPAGRRQLQREYAKIQLPESELARLYQQDELSVRAIAARIGVKHDVISDLAREYGITLRGSKKRRQPADADWTYREYVVQQRTISDMAQEFGVAINTMSRWVKGHGIAVWRDPRTRQPGQTQS